MTSDYRDATQNQYMAHILQIWQIELKQVIFLGTTATRSVIRYWHTSKPKTIGFCTTAKFNENETLDPNGELSPGFKITQGFPQDQNMEIIKVSNQGNPLMKYRIKIMKIKVPPKGKAIGLTISRCEYDSLPYISKSSPSSNYYKSVSTNMRYNVWILAIGNNDSISYEQALEDMKNEQVLNKSIEITMTLSKRDSQVYTRTNIGERWASFDQTRMIKMKIIHSDENNKSISNQMKTSNKMKRINITIQDTKLSRSTQKVKQERSMIANQIIKSQINGKVT